MGESAIVADTFDAAEAAQQHAASLLRTDANVDEVYYLPGEAGPRDVRLLVVGGIVARDAAPLEALDFGVDVGRPGGHTLHIVDITAGQWDAVRAGRLYLPRGWLLDGLVHHGRRAP